MATSREALATAERQAVVQAILETDRLRRRRRRVERLNQAFAFFSALTGAIVAAWCTETVKFAENALLVGITTGVVVLTLGLLPLLIQAQDQVADNEAMVPSDVYFKLRESAQQLEAAEGSLLNLTSWLRFQHIVEREVLRFEQYVFGAFDRPRLSAVQLGDLRTEIDNRFLEILQGVVDGLASGRTALLNYKPKNETYFFDIFELTVDEDTKERLRPIARQYSEGVSVHNRAWEIGEGEVGDCVYQQSTVLRDASVVPLRRGQNHRQTDDIYFARRISTPIFAGDNRPHRAYGAICITSSDPSRFRIEDGMFVENLSQPLAALFQRRDYARAQIQDLLKHSLQGASPSDSPVIKE